MNVVLVLSTSVSTLSSLELQIDFEAVELIGMLKWCRIKTAIAGT